jgi:hypothetical protein
MKMRPGLERIDFAALRRRDFLKGLAASALCTVPVPTTSTTKLTWNPNVVCPLVNPKIYNVPTTGASIKLAAGEHAIVKFPNNAIVTGPVRISAPASFTPTTNGARVHIIGGSIRDDRPLTQMNYELLLIQGVGIAYVEGLFIDKNDRCGSNLVLRGNYTTSGNYGPAGDLIVQNCRFVDCNWWDTRVGDPFTKHGDWIIPQTQTYRLRVDRFTGRTWATGFMFSVNEANKFLPGPQFYKGCYIKNTNMILNNAALNPKPWHKPSGVVGWFGSCSTGVKYSLENIWAYHDTSSSPKDLKGANSLLVPKSDVFSSCAGLVTGDERYGTWSAPPSLGWTGAVKGGIPAGGDFVPASFTGLNYVSPGYADGTA